VDGLKQWGVVLVFVIVVATFSLLLPTTFPTTRNLVNILNNSPALVLFATAATLALILGEFDLSFPAVADLVSVSVGVLVTTFGWKSGLGALGSAALGIGVGAAIGVINGLLIAKAFVPSFVATLAVGSIAAGCELAMQSWISGGAKQISQIVLPPFIQTLATPACRTRRSNGAFSSRSPSPRRSGCGAGARWRDGAPTPSAEIRWALISPACQSRRCASWGCDARRGLGARRRVHGS